MKKIKNLSILFMSLVLVFSLFFGITSFQTKEKTTVSAATETDVSDTINVLDMGTPEHAEVRTLFIQNGDANIITSGFAEYWNDNGATNATSNSNVDLMEYILFDGVSARELVTANAAGTTSYTGPFDPLSWGGVYSPVEVLTVAGNHISIRVLIAFKNTYTLTIKSGFTIKNSENVIYTLLRT